MDPNTPHSAGGGPGQALVGAAIRRTAIILAAAALTTTSLVAAPENQISFGTEMASRGLWSEALFRFRQAEEQSPNDPRILNNIAVSLEALGLYDEALEAYRQAVEAAPTLEHAKRNYARFVEFYQSYRGGEVEEEGPQGDEDGAAAAETEVEAADRDPGEDGAAAEVEEAAEEPTAEETSDNGGDEV